MKRDEIEIVLRKIENGQRVTTFEMKNLVRYINFLEESVECLNTILDACYDEMLDIQIEEVERNVR